MQLSLMRWNWQQPDWPEWRYEHDALVAQEQRFLLKAGQTTGAWSHLAKEDRTSISVEIITAEAMKTSEIEGVYLDRASVQSSVPCAFGLSAERRQGVAESGVADLLTDGFRTWQAPLDEENLFRWNKMVCRGRDDLRDLGGWRQGGNPMRVVSGPFEKPRVHYKAPPAARMTAEMVRFIEWFNASAPNGPAPMAAVARAGIAHLYFVSIHPFEDGNGRIARTLCEKVLAQAIGHPSLAALFVQIEKVRKIYYEKLEANNKSMHVAGWLTWFADIVLEAQAYSGSLINHLICKARLMDRLRNLINARQTKALLRMFEAGPVGFCGGRSAVKYMRITGASPATARRDLGELVGLGALVRTGERKGTRYWLAGR